MLIDVMTHGLGVPTSLSTFALSEIATAILKGRRAAIGGDDHPAGVVTRIGCDVPGKARRGQQALAVLVKNELARWVPVIRAANK